MMSHVYAYGLQCPKAKGIIHLGATSCYVGDNTDLIIMREGLRLVRIKLLNVIAQLSKFADDWKAQPTLAFTHSSRPSPPRWEKGPACGSRSCFWIWRIWPCDRLDEAFGLQGNHRHPGQLPGAVRRGSRKMPGSGSEDRGEDGFSSCYPVSGQTYSRKVDTRVLSVLAGIASSAHKFSNDIRLLQHLKEIEEPLRRARSAPRPWPISAIPCAANGSPLWQTM